MINNLMSYDLHYNLNSELDNELDSDMYNLDKLDKLDNLNNYNLNNYNLNNYNLNNYPEKSNQLNQLNHLNIKTDIIFIQVIRSIIDEEEEKNLYLHYASNLETVNDAIKTSSKNDFIYFEKCIWLVKKIFYL